MHPPFCRPKADRACAPANSFTLVELLATMAVIAILAGLLIPTLSAARASALKAKTRVQLNQWAAAMEQFRQEYGYYPVVGTDGKLAAAADTVTFVRTLSGHNLDGSAVADAADLNGNLKRLSLLVFSETDFFDPDHPAGIPDYSGNELLCDAFGNTEIGVLVDRNGDGFVKPADDGPATAVHGANGEAALVPAETDLPVTGVRGGVLFYTAGRGASPDDMVRSWQ